MAGGNFGARNNKLPAAYVNVFASNHKIVNSENVSGVVFAILNGMNWGVDGVIELTAGDNYMANFGTDLLSEKLVGVRMILSNARKVIAYNVNPGNKATSSVEIVPWDFEAKHNGSVGNSISVTVGPDANSPAKWTVTTTLGTVVVDEQKVAGASELKANDYIIPTVKGSETEDDGVGMLNELQGPIQVGLDGGSSRPNSDTLNLIQTAIETNEFNTLVAANSGDASPMHKLLASSAERLRDQQGRKVQAVVPAAAGTNSNYEGVIAVANAFVLEDGTELTQAQSAAFVAGATASAQPNESLTYRIIPGVKDVVPRFTDNQSIEEIEKGHMVFKAERDQVKILQDINTLHTFTDTKSSDFSKNRPLRVLDHVANVVRVTWEDAYIGKVTNNAAGRDLFKANLAEMLTQLQATGAIENFEVADISVEAGPTKDSVNVTLAITPTDAMEKLYMDVPVR
ncbi:phage tail sheath family protein [Weissella tructae]